MSVKRTQPFPRSEIREIFAAIKAGDSLVDLAKRKKINRVTIANRLAIGGFVVLPALQGTTAEARAIIRELEAEQESGAVPHADR